MREGSTLFVSFVRYLSAAEQTVWWCFLCFGRSLGLQSKSLRHAESREGFLSFPACENWFCGIALLFYGFASRDIFDCDSEKGRLEPQVW